MDNFWKQYCRMCLNTINNENFEEISNITQEILDTLLLKLNLDKNKQVMCKACALKVTEALKFKSMCLYADNTIIPYIDHETGNSLDLLEIYAKEKGNYKLMDTLCDHKVCRLCMQLIKGKFMSVYEVEASTIERYIPEINISIIEDPVICKGCFESIDTHSSFIKNCLEVEEKIKGFRNDNSWVPASDLCIKTENTVIKQELNKYEGECIKNKYTLEIPKKENQYQIKTECIDIKSEQDGESEADPIIEDELVDCKYEHNSSQHSTKLDNNEYSLYEHTIVRHQTTPQEEHKFVHKGGKNRCDTYDLKTEQKYNLKSHGSILETKLFECDTCDFKTKHKGNIKRHMLRHKDICETEMFECNICGFNTKVKSSLQRHMLTHKDISEIELFECNTCGFKTKGKSALKRHMLRHKDIPETEVFECNICGLKTKLKSSLQRHMLTHKDISEIELFECNTCGFKTKAKSTLKRHMLRYKDISETEAFKCDTCGYKTKAKSTLKTHMLRHKDISEIEVFECDTCGYKTRHKGDLKTHMLRHKDISEIEVFKCDTCDYKTKYKYNFQKHLRLTHKDISETEIFECDTCDYKSKYKSAVKRHMLTHKDVSEMKIFECNTCDFKTRYKINFRNHILRHKDLSESILM